MAGSYMRVFSVVNLQPSEDKSKTAMLRFPIKPLDQIAVKTIKRSLEHKAHDAAACRHIRVVQDLLGIWLF